MISEKINVKISKPHQRKYYREKGIDCNLGDVINIDISLLPRYSHIKIKVKCEICETEKTIQFSDYFKCIKKQNFYCCSKCKRIKTDKTNIEKYGFITNLKCEDTKRKIRKTCLEKYGVDNSAKAEENIEKVKQTCLEKYGKEFYPQTDEYKQKVKGKNLEKNGCEYYFQSEEFKIKSEKIQIERYGVSKYTNPEKNKKTCLERYGVEYISQCEEIHKKQMSGFRIKKYYDLYYQGTYELDFLVNFYDKLKIEKPKSIRYIYNDRTKIYFPDFYIPKYNLIVEIKSKYTYNLHKEINECKRKTVLENGYNFILIIDKDYTEFLKYM